MTGYVILGAGAAGTAAVRAIIERDPHGVIKLVSREDPPLLNRPALPYILTGSLPESAAFWDLDAGVDRGRLELLFDRTVESIDAENRELSFRDGESIGFDKLLVASGASPSPPPLPGIDSDGVFGFNTLGDVAGIRKVLARGPSPAGCVILGGGFIGITAATALSKLGMDVSVVETEKTILPGMLDAGAGGFAADLLKSAGVEIFTGTRAVELMRGRSGAVRGVMLESGEELEAGLVIAATGVKPDLALFRDAGIPAGAGVLVDDFLAAGSPGVWAAGDACEGADAVTGRRRYIPNWINAVRQGRIAGVNMAGGNEKYDGSFALNSLVVAGVPVMSFGFPADAEDGYSLHTAHYGAAGVFRRVITRNGRVTGASFIGDAAGAGSIARLAREQVDISGLEDELVEDSAGLVSLLLDLRRTEMEGSVEWPAVLGMTDMYKKKIDAVRWKEREE